MDATCAGAVLRTQAHSQPPGLASWRMRQDILFEVDRHCASAVRPTPPLPFRSATVDAMREPSSMGTIHAASWLGELQDESFRRASRAMRAAYPPDRRMTGSELADYLQRRTYAVASTTRPDGRAHAAPTLFSLSGGAFWLPTLGDAARLRNVRAHPWLALSIVEGEHQTHAAVLSEGPAEVLTAAPQSVWETTRLRNQGDSLDWATAWLRMTPERLLSFAEVEWAGATPTP